jgi:cytidylate kinase
MGQNSGRRDPKRRWFQMYFITISEMLGTRGRIIAKEVAKKLNYDFYGDDELLKAAENSGFAADVHQLQETGPRFLERIFSDKPEVHLDRLQSVVYELAKKGNAVFLGRGSQLMLRAFDCALHVLVSGGKEPRIQRVMVEHQTDRAMAERIVDRSDNDKRRFLRFAFDEDWLNPGLYDLILNTDKLSVDSAVRMIIEAAKSDEIRACGIESVSALARLSLRRKIEAAFLEEKLMRAHIFFDVEDETVRVYGLVTSLEEKSRVTEVLSRIKGIQNVKNDLGVFVGGMQ